MEEILFIIGVILLILFCFGLRHCFSTPNKGKDITVTILHRFATNEESKSFRRKVIYPIYHRYKKEGVKIIYGGEIEMTFIGKNEGWNSIVQIYFPTTDICTEFLQKISMNERKLTFTETENNSITGNNDNIQILPQTLRITNDNNTQNINENKDENSGLYIPALPQTEIITFMLYYFFYIYLSKLFSCFMKPKPHYSSMMNSSSSLPSFSRSPFRSPPSSPSSNRDRNHHRHHDDIIIDDNDDQESNQQNGIQFPIKASAIEYTHLLPTLEQQNQFFRKLNENNQTPIYVINLVELIDSPQYRTSEVEYLKYVLKSMLYSIPKLGARVTYQAPYLTGKWSHFSIMEFPNGEEDLYYLMNDLIYQNAFTNFENAASSVLSFISRPDFVENEFTNVGSEYEV